MSSAEPYCYVCRGDHDHGACRIIELTPFGDDEAVETLEGGQTALAVEGEQRTLPGLGES